MGISGALINELHDLICNTYSVNELNALFRECTELDPTQVVGEDAGTATTAHELISWVERRGPKAVNRLLNLLIAQRGDCGFQDLVQRIRKDVPKLRPATPRAGSNNDWPQFCLTTPLHSEHLLPHRETFVGRDAFRKAIRILHVSSAHRVLFANGPDRVGKSFCSKYLQALLKNSDSVRLCHIQFNGDPSRYGESAVVTINRLLTEWRLEPLLDSGDDSPGRAVDEMGERICSPQEKGAQFWAVFDQFPLNFKDKNATDYLIEELLTWVSLHLTPLRLVVLGYNKEYMDPGRVAVEPVNLEHLTYEELRSFFRHLETHIPCEPVPQVQRYLADYASAPDGPGRWQMLDQLPDLIRGMFQNRYR